MEAVARSGRPALARRTEQLIRLCEPPPGHGLYAVLDGASIGELPAKLLGSGAEFACLYRGELIRELAAAAPYLVRLDTAPGLRDQVLAHWGEHWGILLDSRAGLRTLRNHFRRLLLVWGPGQRALYLRFYDPRVFAMLAPVFEPAQVRKLFGPVECYWGEGSGPDEICRYQAQAGVIEIRQGAIA